MWVIRLCCGKSGRELGKDLALALITDPEQLHPSDEMVHQSWILQIDSFLQSFMSWQFLWISENSWLLIKGQFRGHLKYEGSFAFDNKFSFWVDYDFSDFFLILFQLSPSCMSMADGPAFSRPDFGKIKRVENCVPESISFNLVISMICNWK